MSIIKSGDPLIAIHISGNEGGGIRSVTEKWYHGFLKKNCRVNFVSNHNGEYARYLRKTNRSVYCANIGEIKNRSKSIGNIQFPDFSGWIRSYHSKKIAQKRVERILNGIKPDVVLGNGASSPAVIGDACKSCGIEMVSCFHGISDSRDFLKFRKRVIAFILNRYCRSVVGVSKATLADIIPYLKIPHHVLFNTSSEIITNKKVGIELRKKFGIPETAFVFGNASRINASKAIHRFVQAASNIMEYEKSSPIYFLIAGDARTAEEKMYLESIISFINRENLQNQIKYIGYQSISDFYSAIDVFCHTHEAIEPLGLTVVEALSAGLPVIVCDRGGYLEFLPEDVGVRYRSNSYEQLSEAMMRMLDDTFRNKQAENGKQFFNHSFIKEEQWVESWLKTLLSPTHHL